VLSKYKTEVNLNPTPLLRKERRKIQIRIYRIKKKIRRFYKDEFDESTLEFYAIQIVKLCLLDLSPAKEILLSLYSKKPRGNKPRDPIAMLRSLILMTLLHIHSITTWVSNLKAFPLFAILSGFEPDDVPGVGTFYDFINRIYPENYPFSKNTLLPPRRKPTKKLAQNEKLPPKHPDIVNKLVKRAIKYIDNPLPLTPAHILNNILKEAFVKVSAKMGILGDIQNMFISGDGTTIKTGANPLGVKDCNCKSKGIYKCDCPRRFSDPQARWGWDSYNEQYVYGHAIYSLTAADSHYDLPIYIRFAQCQRHDSTISVVALTEAFKMYQNTFSFSIFAGDTAHDNYPFYYFLNFLDIAAVIPLNETNKGNLKFNTPFTINDDGSVSCSYGKMVFWSFCKDRCRLKWRCHLYKFSYEERLILCKNAHICSDSKYGRTIYTHPQWDYRLFTRIPCDSELWKQKMKRRTNSERCNKRMKVDYHLERARVRSTKHWFVRTSLVVMCQHMDAWYNKWLKTI